jgi:hypothetical protein
MVAGARGDSLLSLGALFNSEMSSIKSVGGCASVISVCSQTGGRVVLSGWFVDWLHHQTFLFFGKGMRMVHAAIPLLVATISYKTQPPHSRFLLP